MPTLGCPRVNVTVQPRGGGRAIPIPRGVGSTRNWSSLEWHRLDNDSSGAQLRVEGRARCCDWASRVIPWKHELVVYYDNVRVWSGPVTNVDWTGDELRIGCKDRMEWMRRRKIHYDHIYGAAVDLSTIFSELVVDGLSIDTSPNITLSTTASGVVVGSPEGRTYKAATARYVNDAINELAREGVYWTVIDFTCYVTGIATPSNTDPILRAVHFADAVDGTSEGNDFGTRFNFIGAGTGEAGDTIAAVNAIDPVLEAAYGVHEVIISDSDITDQATAQAAATHRFNVDGRNGIPFYVNGGTLMPTAPVATNDLIVGRIFRVEHEDPCRPAPQHVRLTGVHGSVGPEKQSVIVDFSPVLDEG